MSPGEQSTQWLAVQPLAFELFWSDVTQRRVDPLVPAHLVQEPTQLVDGIRIVLIVRQVNLLFFDSPDQTLSASVLPSFAYFGHTDLHVGFLGHLDIVHDPEKEVPILSCAASHLNQMRFKRKMLRHKRTLPT